MTAEAIALTALDTNPTQSSVPLGLCLLGDFNSLDATLQASLDALASGVMGFCFAKHWCTCRRMSLIKFVKASIALESFGIDLDSVPECTQCTDISASASLASHAPGCVPHWLGCLNGSVERSRPSRTPTSSEPQLRGQPSKGSRTGNQYLSERPRKKIVAMRHCRKEMGVPGKNAWQSLTRP